MDSLKHAVAQNIRELRTMKSISAADLADKLGVSQSTVSDWETSKKMPRAGAIEKIAEFFGVLKSDILTSRDERIKQAEKPAEYQVIDVDYLLSSNIKVVVAGRLLSQEEKNMAARLLNAAFGGGEE